MPQRVAKVQERHMNGSRGCARELASFTPSPVILEKNFESRTPSLFKRTRKSQARELRAGLCEDPFVSRQCLVPLPKPSGAKWLCFQPLFARFTSTLSSFLESTLGIEFRRLYSTRSDAKVLLTTCCENRLGSCFYELPSDGSS